MEKKDEDEKEVVVVEVPKNMTKKLSQAKRKTNLYCSNCKKEHIFKLVEVESKQVWQCEVCGAIIE